MQACYVTSVRGSGALNSRKVAIAVAPLLIGAVVTLAYMARAPDERQLGRVELGASTIDLRAKLITTTAPVVQVSRDGREEELPSRRHWFLKIELDADDDGEPVAIRPVGEPSPVLLSVGWAESHELLNALELTRCEHPSGELATVRIQGGIYDSGWRHIYAREGLVFDAKGPSEVEGCEQAQALAPSLHELLQAL